MDIHIAAWGNWRETFSFLRGRDIVRASREKRKDVSGQTRSAVRKEPRIVMASPDRTGDLLLPFWSGDPQIQNLRKLQRIGGEKR